MPNRVRVRYAPSPTGEPHLGNIRTAIFNWLFVQHHRREGAEASFIVRVEDTDQARLVPGALEAILEALRWLGLDWDEGPDVGGPYGPYFQSRRLHLYHQAAQRLLESGRAYPCYCSAERLDEMRKEQQRRKEPPGYDRRCRDLTPDQRRRHEDEGITPVIRFKMPLSGETVCNDLVRGEVTFENRLLDDFVILKSDGYPTYHLANVVDDHAMEITHVLRAEEWLSSLPRHLLLYEALGYPPPLFAHLPMILGPDRSKLSKRHGATSILDYKRRGYLPDAMLNFLALLGWSLDDHTEIISRDQLIQHFSLERVTRAGAIFNVEKLDWMNGVYIRQLSVEELADRLLPFLEDGLPPDVPRPLDRTYLRRIVPLVQERLKVLSEGPELTSFFFQETLEYDPSLLVGKSMDRDTALHVLEVAERRLGSLESWDADSLEGLLRPLAEELGLKTGQLFGVLRVAVTGRTAAPPLFATMDVLGRERCLRRIADARQRLAALPVP